MAPKKPASPKEPKSSGPVSSRQAATAGKQTKHTSASAGTKAAGGAGMRYMQTRLSDAGWKSLKLLSIELEKPLQGLVIDALNDLLRKHGKAPDVTGPDSEAGK